MSLKHTLLTLLNTEPGSGYDLQQRFKNRLGYFWNASHQQIYQQLKKMLEQGLIEFTLEPQAGKPDRKVYQLRPAGEQELLQWLQQPAKPNKINDALLVKLYGGDLLQPQELMAEIEEHQQLHRKMLDTFLALEAEYLALPASKQTPLKLPYLTLRRGIIGEEAWLRWAEEAKVTINELTE
ncbi:MAG: PadR family transcriptional regulator [Candidatus Pelagadaptatus aseana]|uniref:PadR family transcriptional regulator n=1 Tax=Candidatus Pelagadaptatus aseana TaxID=3120508 RepID=UPI0039B2A2AE